MRRKYALHPGPVRSKHDGQKHYIGVRQLARLYQLRESEYVVWVDEPGGVNRGRRRADYIHLYPRHDGNYRRPE